MHEEPSRIFVSYSRDDFPFVKELVMRLRDSGFEVWFDVLEIRIGENYLAEIEGAMEWANYCIVVVSRYSMASAEVTREIGLAGQKGRKIVPLILQGATLPPTLRPIHWLDFRVEFESPMQALISGLRHAPQGSARDLQALAPPLRLSLTGPGRNRAPRSVVAVVLLVALALCLQFVPAAVYLAVGGVKFWPVCLLYLFFAVVVFRRIRAVVERQADRFEILTLPGWVLVFLPWSVLLYVLAGEIHVRLATVLTVANSLTAGFALAAFLVAHKAGAVRRWAISYPKTSDTVTFLGIKLWRR